MIDPGARGDLEAAKTMVGGTHAGELIGIAATEAP
jgi:hypothetical protein